MTTEKHGFEAEVSRLLHMMVHSVYSDREIFLRELISNASDACDKLRYAGLTNADLIKDAGEFAIDIRLDKDTKTLTVSDNGIGMNKDDLISHLGTIARSGTSAFMENISGDEKKDVNLIGQFGVGFYSVFMVADKVEVLSRKAGEEQGYLWSSDGIGEYTISDAEKAGPGTSIMLHIKDDAEEFLEVMRLKNIIKTYSDHVTLPITLISKNDDKDAEEKETSEKVNDGTALWARPKTDITDEQYKEFYHHVAHAYDDPGMTIHYRAEGMIEYTVLLFVPSQQPMDLFDPARKTKVKLYVKRVFITDDCEDLLPSYLRFIRGVVDSEDLPLNISREMLQNNPVMTTISKAVTKRVLSELEKKQKKDREGYEKFWESFGAVLKEGIYEDFERRDQILKMSLFNSTEGDDLTTLEDYVSRMNEGQDTIYYITADNLAAAKRSPQLEGFKAKGIEVLYFVDPVDEFWLQMMPEFDGKKLASVTRGSADLDDKKDDEKDQENAPELDALIGVLKTNLGEAVKDVRKSNRLTDSAVCLVADDNDMDMHMERILKMHNKLDGAASARVMEINAENGLIKALASQAAKDGSVDALKDASLMLLDQARIIEGEVPEDPVAFAARLSKVMEESFK
ncbi:molecular chaperone HtpG [Pseudemcibacter aquimaris]|uniref:molecular chaperone HtpG n=1 Tax=Pseudemcibacter aquimaris TaxID=2857064 RepID=UPI002011C72B|nr:molecular chaperone HtpG [Pseudemcibacter aquimaris]MCC3861942.1 molecular chaperone HtpG [Pseudemcibacter aquimaris]WDU58694.1 molecular chaperone HtpG [Pseudemcibacter aquimaris]